MIDMLDIDITILGRNIRYLRTLKGWNQDDLAEDIHLARSTYSCYETGEKIPDLQTLDALAAIYDIGFEVLVSPDLTDSLLGRVCFGQEDKEMGTLLNDYLRLSIASKNIVAEDLRLLLERESVFYQAYAKKRGLLQEQPGDDVDGNGNGDDGGNGA